MTASTASTAPLELRTDYWSPERLEPVRELRPLSTGEVADCTCPDFCERDHSNE